MAFSVTRPVCPAQSSPLPLPSPTHLSQSCRQARKTKSRSITYWHAVCSPPSACLGLANKTGFRRSRMRSGILHYQLPRACLRQSRQGQRLAAKCEIVAETGCGVAVGCWHDKRHARSAWNSSSWPWLLPMSRVRLQFWKLFSSPKSPALSCCARAMNPAHTLQIELIYQREYFWYPVVLWHAIL